MPSRIKEEEDSEKEHADFAHMTRTEDDSEVDLTSEAESEAELSSEDESGSDEDESLDKHFASSGIHVRSSGKTNKKGPRKWVPKNKIIYFADIINSSIEISRKKSICSKNWNLKLLLLMKLGTTRMPRLVEILVITHQFKRYLLMLINISCLVLLIHLLSRVC